ncbi:EcsC family protein [Nocardioides sp.]|uniref:EcsC family protein n=1 Tax=Nocardioides sp. TaxID=35761 RepID=UPI003D0ED695
MSVKSSIGKSVAPHVTGLAPGLTDSFVREALKRAVSGVGPLPGAAAAAEALLSAHHGDVAKATKEIIDKHVRYAGAQGFVTNLGGLVTAVVAIPTNVTGLALIQCRMIAAIAHLRGYDLDDPRVRNAILISMLGSEGVDRLVKKKKLPAPPMAVATAPAHDPDLDVVISAEVASELVTRIAGKRLATVVGRRVPVVGGLFGLSADAYVTWRVGRYAAGELLPRARR